MKLYSVIILISFTFSSSLFPCPFLSPSLFLYFLLPHYLLLLSHTHSLTLLSSFLPHSPSSSPSSLHFYLLEILRRLALHGLVHCDFNEFNLMVDQEGQVTLIDFPQVCTAQHVLTLCGTVYLCV